jgi:hypothetical protein
MSFYFSIQTTKSVTYQSLVDNLDIPNVQFYLQPENISDPIVGAKIYLPGKSTRGITISKEQNAYSIGINVIASEEDFNLAIQTSRAIAELTNGSILPEDQEEEMDPGQLLEKFDQEWIDSMKTLGISIFIEKIGKEKGVLSIGCCYMQYSVGPKIHATLDTSSQLIYYNNLVDHIQKTQFFDLGKYSIPNLLVASKPDGTQGKTYVVFQPRGNQFLSQANFVIFPVGEGSYEIPYEMIEEIADGQFKRIDEIQYTIEPLSEVDYQNIIGRIEGALSKVSEEEIGRKYANLDDHELDREYNRIASIPNARVKIFALQRMSTLISEYEKRNIVMPGKRGNPKAANSDVNSPEGKSISANQSSSSSKQIPKLPKDNTNKPWWKFW